MGLSPGQTCPGQGLGVGAWGMGWGTPCCSSNGGQDLALPFPCILVTLPEGDPVPSNLFSWATSLGFPQPWFPGWGLTEIPLAIDPLSVLDQRLQVHPLANPQEQSLRGL